MIDIEKTLSLRGYDPLMLSHASDKRVWSVCNKCGKGRWITFRSYRELCQSCSRIKQFATQSSRDAASKRTTEYFDVHPESREAARLKTIEQWNDPKYRKMQLEIAIKRWSDQDNCDAQSERILNSEAAKVWQEKMRGGLDIVDHHMIYDHSDLSKNIMKMTRSMHGKLHRLFQIHGIDIPHIK